MLKIKNLFRIPAVPLVIIGFFAGSLLPGAQSSCCCANSDNCCCCIPDKTEPDDVQSTGISGACGCEMKEGDSPEFTSLKAQIYTKSQNKIDKSESLPRCRESLAALSPVVLIKIESTRNSGPPIFISISSFLI